MVSTLAAMGVLMDGYDLGVIGFSAIMIAQEFGLGLHSAEYALLLSSALLGMAVGGVAFGWLADRVGRRSAFIVDLVFFVVFAALSAASQDALQVIVFRFLMGIGIGADYPVSSSLISEFAPARSRGRLLMYGIMFYWIGTLISYMTNFLALGLGVSLAWRAAMAFGAVLAVPVILARGSVPESARWLARRAQEASHVHVHIHRFSELFTRYWRSVTYVLVAWFLFDVAAYGIGYYSSTLYKLYGISSLRAIALFGALSSLAPIASYFALMWLVERAGRRPPTIVGFAGMAAVLLALPLLLPESGILLLPLFSAFAFMEQWPGGVLSFAYSVELFPTEVRARAQGLATAVSRIGAFAGTYLLPVTSAHGLWEASSAFAALALAGAVVTWAIAPETAGRTLEEISGAGVAPAHG